MLEWNLYPVNCLLKNLYERNIKPTTNLTTGARPHPVDVEMLAVAERLMNYGHTGNIKVFPRHLFNSLTTLRSILDHGFPYIPTHFLTFGGHDSRQPIVHVANWPVFLDEKPMDVAKRALQLTYSNAHFTVSV